MKIINKLIRKVGLSKTMILYTGLLVAGADAMAVPTLFIDQSTSITGAADTLKAARVPVRNNAGVVSYWDITMKFTADGISGKPILTPANTLVVLSPPLITGAFKAGNYKDT